MKNNFTFKILAILLAVLLWLYVTNQQNPLTEVTFSVPLDIKNIPAKLVVSDKISSVTVRVMARKNLVDKTSSKDIYAYLNLQNTKIGINKVPISVTVPKDIQLVSVSPVQGDVNLTTVSSQQFTLKLQLANTLPQGYVMLTQQVTPTQVVISGPLDILEKVSKTVVEVDLTGQKTNYVQRLPIRVFDKEGNDLSDWLIIKPNIAETFIAVSPTQPRKQVAVKPIFEGVIPQGKKIVRIVTEPQLVTIAGSEELLKNLYVLGTMPINLTDKNDSFSIDIFLNTPQGISIYPTGKIKVIVEIAK